MQDQAEYRYFSYFFLNGFVVGRTLDYCGKSTFRIHSGNNKHYIDVTTIDLVTLFRFSNCNSSCDFTIGELDSDAAAKIAMMFNRYVEIIRLHNYEARPSYDFRVSTDGFVDSCEKMLAEYGDENGNT